LALTAQISIQSGRCLAKTMTSDVGEVIQKIDVVAFDKNRLPTQVIIDGSLNGFAVSKAGLFH